MFGWTLSDDGTFETTDAYCVKGTKKPLSLFINIY